PTGAQEIRQDRKELRQDRRDIPLQALPPDDAGRARPRRPGSQALERAPGVAQAGAAAALRALSAAAPRAPQADPGAPAPVRGHATGTARARDPELRALAVPDAAAAPPASRAL